MKKRREVRRSRDLSTAPSTLIYRTEVSSHSPTDSADMKVTKGQSDESSVAILCQVAPSLFIAGLGMLFAGVLLESFQSAPVFAQMPGLLAMVPALLGLKGNLEMTMASRISSVANLGLLTTPKQRSSTSRSNMALIQCQSIVVGSSAALFAGSISFLTGRSLSMTDLLRLVCTAIGTASLASFLLAYTMIRIIQWALDSGVNPDNVATPIAAALGDFVTLFILLVVAFFTTVTPTAGLVILLLIVLWALPQFWKVARENAQTEAALREGWLPVMCAMLISSLGGSVLERALHQYPAIAAYQPLVNGVGGNLAAIAASRLSSALHIEMNKSSNGFCDKESLMVSSGGVEASLNPVRFLSKKVNRMLLTLVIPCQFAFVCLLSLLQNNSLLHPVLACCTASFLQVFVLLFLVENILAFSHRHGFDPDNFGIPFLTAIGDLLGCSGLWLAFHFLFRSNQL